MSSFLTWFIDYSKKTTNGTNNFPLIDNSPLTRRDSLLKVSPLSSCRTSVKLDEQIIDKTLKREKIIIDPNQYISLENGDSYLSCSSWDGASSSSSAFVSVSSSHASSAHCLDEDFDHVIGDSTLTTLPGALSPLPLVKVDDSGLDLRQLQCERFDDIGITSTPKDPTKTSLPNFSFDNFLSVLTLKLEEGAKKPRKKVQFDLHPCIINGDHTSNRENHFKDSYTIRGYGKYALPRLKIKRRRISALVTPAVAHQGITEEISPQVSMQLSDDIFLDGEINEAFAINRISLLSSSEVHKRISLMGNKNSDLLEMTRYMTPEGYRRLQYKRILVSRYRHFNTGRLSTNDLIIKSKFACRSNK